MKVLLMIMLVAFVFVGCGTIEESGANITVPNQTQLTQNVYADDNAGKSGVTFTTAGAWTSEIKESAITKSTRSTTDWISISPSSGDKAGDYTISISLKTNYTGEKRTAIISLKCSDEMVDVVVTQEALTAAGDKPTPDPVPSGSGELKNETTGQSVKLVAMKHDIEASDRVRIKFIGEGGNGDEYLACFYNPLKDGKLRSGVYNIKLQNSYPQPEMIDGDCEWYKSFLGDYGSSGTIKVELNNDTYTFTFDILIGEGTKLTGSFTGIPEYLNKEVKVESITLNETNKTIEVGDNFMLTATILPENATNKRYTWSSSNPTIATVDNEGRVAAIKAGSSIITVTTEDGNKNTQCAVTVTDVASTGSGTFTNNISNSSQNIVKVTHEARYFNNVILKFYGADNYSAFNLFFNNTLTGGRLKPGTYTFVQNGEGQGMVVGEKPYHIADATAQSGTVTVAASGDTYTVTLDLTGIYYPPKEDGVSCKITGSYVGEFVYVNEFIPVTSISMNKTTLELERGKSETLTATIQPTNASHKNILWSSSNPDVASVYNGQVTAHSVGSATITATTEDGAKVASCAVTVKPRESTGSGTFTYKFDDNSQTSTFSPTYVENFGGMIRFRDDNDYEAIYFSYTTHSKTLEAGVYEWEIGSTSSRTWRSQKGDFGKMIFYCEGTENPGTITVTKSGDIYTITLNWNVSEFGGDDGRKGKITGTYTGKIANL